VLHTKKRGVTHLDDRAPFSEPPQAKGAKTFKPFRRVKLLSTVLPMDLSVVLYEIFLSHSPNIPPATNETGCSPV